MKGPVDEVPHPAFPVFTNLQPGPKLNPPGYVFGQSFFQIDTLRPNSDEIIDTPEFRPKTISIGAGD